MGYSPFIRLVSHLPLGGIRRRDGADDGIVAVGERRTRQEEVLELRRVILERHFLTVGRSRHVEVEQAFGGLCHTYTLIAVKSC